MLFFANGATDHRSNRTAYNYGTNPATDRAAYITAGTSD